MHAVSTHVATTMAHHLHFPLDRIDVIPRGRDPRELGTRTGARRAAACALALDLTDANPMVFAAARHAPPKGLDVLLDGFAVLVARLPQARLIIAGREGSETPRLQAALRGHRLDDRVRFLGERDDVADLMCAADVFVLPSRREGFPGVLVEAMALDAPIVASDIPQVREVVDDGLAKLFPVDDPGQLAAAIADVLCDREATSARVARGRQRFEERFTIASVADATIVFYERARGGRSDSARSDEDISR